MDSDKYFKWCNVPNTVNSRLKNNSLVHTFTSEKKIRKSTKLINELYAKTFNKHSYAHFKQFKQHILKQLKVNNDVTDVSDLDHTYFKSYYDSFNSTNSNLYTEAFLWHDVAKHGKDQSKPNDLEQFYFCEPSFNVIDNSKNLSNSKIGNHEQIVKSTNSIEKDVTPRNLIKSKNSTVKNTLPIKEVSRVSKGATIKNSSLQEQKSQKSKKVNRTSKNVKKNLASTLADVSVRAQEFAGGEWSDDFAATEFQAQSTQIFSDSFSEKEVKGKHSTRYKLPPEPINQPRDSGIEEDSREDNIKFGKPVDEQKYNKNVENNKYDKPETCNEKNIDNLNDADNNLHQNKVKKTPYKKIPLKIIGEETVTKKFKIISNKHQGESIEEEKIVESPKSKSVSTDIKVNPTNNDVASSSESDLEFADCQNANDSQYNKSDSGSSDEYFDLKENSSEKESEDDQEENNDESVSQNGNNEEDAEESEKERENEKIESDNSSMNESTIRKRNLKERLKNCSSPYMMRRYAELKKSGIFEESDVETKIKLIKHTEIKSKKTFVASSKSSEIKKERQSRASCRKDTPKKQKLMKGDKTLLEDKTLIAEDLNNISLNSKKHQLQDVPSLSEGSKINQNKSKYNNINNSDLNANTLGTKIENKENSSKSKKRDSDSIVSDTTNSQTSIKSKQLFKKLKPSGIQEQQEDNSSSCEESVELATQGDLKNVVNDFKKTLLPPTSKVQENLNESSESPVIGTQFQSTDKSQSVHESSDDSENSEVEKTVINLKNQSKIQEKKKISDSDKNNDSLKNKSSKVNKIKQKERTIEESSSEEDSCNLEDLKAGTFNTDDTKNEDSEDEFIMSSKSKEHLNKIKRLDLLNNSEDSDDSENVGEVLKNDCNSDVDIEEHKVEFSVPSAEVQKETSDVESNNSNSIKNNKNMFKRKFTSINSENTYDDKDSLTSQDIDVVHYSSENDTNNQRKIKKFKTSKFGTDLIGKEDIDTFPSSSNMHMKPNIVLSENESNDDDSDQAMSYYSKRKIKQLQKMNLLTNNSNSSSEDEETSERPRNKKEKVHKKGTNKKSTVNSSDSDSEKKKDLHEVKTNINKNKNKMISQKELNKENTKSDVEDEKDDIFDKDIYENEDSEKECVMSSQTKERLNKMKRLDLYKKSKVNPSDSDPDSNCDSRKNKDLHDVNTHVNKKQNEMTDKEVSSEKDNESDVEDEKDDIVDEKNSKNEDSEEECTMSSQTKERLNKMKRLDLFKNSKDNASDSDSDSNSDSENKKDLHEVNTNNINKKQNKPIDKKTLNEKDNESDVEDEKDDIVDEKNSKNEDSEEECTMSSQTKERLNKMKRLDLFKNSKDNSSDSDSDSNSDSEKNKDVNTNINTLKNKKIGKKALNEKDNKSDVEDEKDDIVDEKKSKNEDSEEECTMSSQTKQRLNKMKRLDLLHGDEDSDDSNDFVEDKNDNSDIDIEEHKIEDLITQRDLQINSYSTKNPINSNELGSEVIVKKSEIKNKKSSVSILDAADGTGVDNKFDKGKGKSKEKKKSKKKDIIIQETQESVSSQKSILESQPMFSSLEDMREGIDEKQLSFEIESDVNANSLKDTSQIPVTQAPIKKSRDKITKIPQLVEKENLEKITCESTMNINQISADEEIFVLEVPKTIFKDNLIGKKISFLKSTLTIGNNRYEAVQKQVSPTYSCVLKTEKKALDSFTTQNIRPVATIIARRKKAFDESIKDSDNEEIMHESSVNKETHFNGNNSVKDKSLQEKATKKVSKRSKKSQEKEIVDTAEKSKKKTPKKSKATDILEKRRKFVHRLKRQVLTDDTSNNEITVGQSHDNINPSCLPEEVQPQATVKKSFLKKSVNTNSSKNNQAAAKKSSTKEAVNVNTSKDSALKKTPKSPGKLKKTIAPAEDAKEPTEAKVPDTTKNTKPVKKPAKSESKPFSKKRKAENQPTGDPANPDEKEEIKKKKVTGEKKEKKPRTKAVKKKVVEQSGESAAEQIRKLISKNMKFDESLNNSFDPSNYNPLDIQRVPKKQKRCQSTSSSSSDDDSKFKRSSFHVRVKTKPEEGESMSASSVALKTEDKKSVKKVFFDE